MRSSLTRAAALAALLAPLGAAREVAVHPPRPLVAGEGLALVLEPAGRLDLRAGRDGAWLGRLPDAQATARFRVVRTPGDVAEHHAKGGPVPARSLPAGAGRAHLFPTAWADGALPGRPHRTGLHEDFLVPPGAFTSLPRPVRVHLPRAYLHDPARAFPVIYVLDGQNAFDGTTSYGGAEWNLDEVMAALEHEGLAPAILVGVDNGLAARMREYTYTPDPEHGGGEAARHLRFLLEEVEPAVRARYRIDPARRMLIGSSLGGLFGLWAALRHGDSFAAIAALSPSIWWANEAVTRLDRAGARPRLWVDMGTREGERSVEQLATLTRRLADQGWSLDGDLAVRVVPGAEHRETAWATRAADVLRFLLASP